MTRNELRQLIALRLGNRTDLNDAIDLHIRLAQTELEKQGMLPWFLSELTTISLSADATSVAVPTGFLREYETLPLLYDASGVYVRKLQKADYDEITSCYPEANTGSPKVYALVNETLYFRPVPDAAYSVKMFAYIADTELATDVANAWSMSSPMSLVAEAGKMVSQYILNTQAYAGFEALAAEAVQSLRVANDSRDMANRLDSMGGSHGT